MKNQPKADWMQIGCVMNEKTRKNRQRNYFMKNYIPKAMTP